MIARAVKPDPLNTYVSAIIVIGAVCGVGIVLDGVGDFHLLLTPEIALFALCALIGDFLPLKVFTRGAEGEITTSTCFMFAALLAGGPLAALIALVVANVVVDVQRRKELKKSAFNLAQLAITVAASGAVLKLTTGHAARRRAAHAPERPARA